MLRREGGPDHISKYPHPLVEPLLIEIVQAKPSVGHSEGAAGLTSLIKAVLTLEHRRIPPNVHFSKPNPKSKWQYRYSSFAEWSMEETYFVSVPFDKYKLRVPTELEEWPQDRAERVSINSFGVGGVNAHVHSASYPISRV